MRMKKQLVLAALVAIAATACTKTFQVAPVTEGPAIDFGTWANTLTKAPRTNTFADDETFRVYGTKTTPTVTQGIVFNGDVVTYSVDASAWSYSPIRFWDPTATNYTFFAVMPSSVSLAVESTAGDYPKSGIFSSDEIIFDAPTTEDQDILVASKKEISSITYNDVQLDFNHIASLIDVYVKKDAALPVDATLKITDAELRNINIKGTFEVKSYSPSTNVPIIGTTVWGWVPDDASTTGTYSAGNPLNIVVTNKTAYDASSGAANGTTDASGGDVTVPGGLQSLFKDYVLMPQNLEEQVLYIAYDIITQVSPEVKTSYTKEIPIASFVTTDDKDNPDPEAGTSWNPGTHYIYTLTIGANAIAFTASVNAWSEVSGYKYLVQ